MQGCSHTEGRSTSSCWMCSQQRGRLLRAPLVGGQIRMCCMSVLMSVSLRVRYGDLIAIACPEAHGIQYVTRAAWHRYNNQRRLIHWCMDANGASNCDPFGAVSNMPPTFFWTEAWLRDHNETAVVGKYSCECTIVKYRLFVRQIGNCRTND